MTKLRVYLDTSVLSAYHDARCPERMRETREFWARLGEFDVATSDWTRHEIAPTRSDERRKLMLELLASVSVFPVTTRMRELAAVYEREGAFTSSMKGDALHVAAAVSGGWEVLASWNFKHLVNRGRRGLINAVNAAHGLPSLEIIAPPEI